MLPVALVLELVQPAESSVGGGLQRQWPIWWVSEMLTDGHRLVVHWWWYWLLSLSVLPVQCISLCMSAIIRRLVVFAIDWPHAPPDCLNLLSYSLLLSFILSGNGNSRRNISSTISVCSSSLAMRWPLLTEEEGGGSAEQLATVCLQLSNTASRRLFFKKVTCEQLSRLFQTAIA